MKLIWAGFLMVAFTLVCVWIFMTQHTYLPPSSKILAYGYIAFIAVMGCLAFRQSMSPDSELSSKTLFIDVYARAWKSLRQRWLLLLICIAALINMIGGAIEFSVQRHDPSVATITSLINVPGYTAGRLQIEQLPYLLLSSIKAGPFHIFPKIGLFAGDCLGPATDLLVALVLLLMIPYLVKFSRAEPYPICRAPR